MTQTNRHLTTLLLGAGLLTTLSGCGGKVSTGGGENKNERTNSIEQELTLEGKYEIKLTGLNSGVGGFTTGKGKLHLIADSITAEIAVKDAPAMHVHPQFIYSGTECPSEAHDTNNDGFIDPIEAAKVIGKILIPLDADLDSQLMGSDAFPVADTMGGYVYFKEGSISKMVADLKSPDNNLKDEITKLSNNEDLKLEGKVVIIQGVPEEVYLPGSVRTFGELSERETLPIACGKIIRLMNPDTETHEVEEQN